MKGSMHIFVKRISRQQELKDKNDNHLMKTLLLPVVLFFPKPIFCPSLVRSIIKPGLHSLYQGRENMTVNARTDIVAKYP